MKKEKKLISILLFIFACLLSANLFAQSAGVMNTEVDSNQVTQIEEESQPVVKENAPAEQAQSSGLELFARNLVGNGLVDVFIQGGFTMWPILVLFLWGVATIIWKIFALLAARINVTTFLEEIIPHIEKANYKEAITICENTKGPVSAVVYAGLLKAKHGPQAVEKAMESAGVLEMAFLDKGFVAFGTAISLGPMFGFFGTLVGMIQAFDAIAKAGEVDPTIVASGIKVALITSAAGLAIAIPVQLFNNIFTSWVDGVVIDMQRGSEKVIETIASTN